MKKIITLLAILGSSVAMAQGSAVEELQKMLTTTQSMQANFNQTVFNEKLVQIQTASGTMAYKKPNLFKWQVIEPDATLLITDGKKLWNYDVALEQVTVQKYTIDKEISPLSFILDDAAQINVDFTVELQANDCFKLTPRQENSNFVNVSVCFANTKIKSLAVLDHLGQTSLFEFSKMQVNIPLSSADFSFTPPAGVDVVGD